MLATSRKLVNRRGASQAAADLEAIVADLRTLHHDPDTLAMLERAEGAISKIRAGLDSWRQAEQQGA